MQALCFQVFLDAYSACEDQSWQKDCYIWLYRGKDQMVSSHEIDMAVPMSPDQLQHKREMIRKFQSINEEAEFAAPSQNQDLALNYDQLGMAQYEAIEAFEKLMIAL